MTGDRPLGALGYHSAGGDDAVEQENPAPEGDSAGRASQDPADIHPPWISHLESGSSNPSWGSVARLAHALRMQVSELTAMAETVASSGGAST